MNIQIDLGCGEYPVGLLENIDYSYCFDIEPVEFLDIEPDEINKYKLIQADLTKPIPENILNEIKQHNVKYIFLQRSVREILYLEPENVTSATFPDDYLQSLNNLSELIYNLSNKKTVVRIFDDLFHMHFLLESLIIKGFCVNNIELINPYFIHDECIFGDFKVTLMRNNE